MNTTQPKPIHVSGYVRNKKEIEAAKRAAKQTDKANTLFAVMILGSTIVILAIIFWQVTTAIMATVLAGIIAKRRIAKIAEARRAEQELNINYYWRRNWYDTLLSR